MSWPLNFANWLMRIGTIRAFEGIEPYAAIVESARAAFVDSRYERRMTAALLMHLGFRGSGARFIFSVAHWLDMLSRNAEAAPILKAYLDLNMNPSLACQYAWAIADTATTDAFDECESYIACAATIPEQAPVLADTRAWMAYRRGDLSEAQRLLAPITLYAQRWPDLAFHIAKVSYDLGDKLGAKLYLDMAFTHQRPFSGYYEAARLRSMLRLEVATEDKWEDVMMLRPPVIRSFVAEEKGLVVDMRDETLVLTWDRLWELADATLEEKQACELTPDRIGLVWPKLKFAQSSLHLKEAVMLGQVPPENRPLYGKYPTTWYEPGGPLS